MHIKIQAGDSSLTEALGDYIERRINFALSSRYEQIQSISVHLSNINGSDGGSDKCCRIKISLPRLSDIIIEDTESDLHVAIDRAIDRAGRTVNRRLARHYNKNRKLFIPHNNGLVLEMNAQ
jgi:ribosome-associated translation inhibitor RaiA